jgi:hypothetical protein
VFADEATGGWIYASNSEDSSAGGVGAITFDSSGNVIGYQHILGLSNSTLPKTQRNCGGGKTYWNTWLTCEEHDAGQVWETDPWGNILPKKTVLAPIGMAYESAAYDNRSPAKPTFYVTVDTSDGPLVRFTPNPLKVSACIPDANGKYRNVDCSPMLYDKSNTTHTYYHYFRVLTLVVKDAAKGVFEGTYEWTTDLTRGKNSAATYHFNGEGIDIKDGKLYYTTKSSKYLFIINLDKDSGGKLTFQRSSTVSGAFDGQPDQVARVLDYATGATDGILYFCEDGGTGDNHGVHGRDSNGLYFTIFKDDSSFTGETTGLAFSPNGIFMYVAFQGPGYIYEIKRTDGFPFQGTSLDILHHSDDSNPNMFLKRNLVDAENAKTCELVREMCPSDE